MGGCIVEAPLSMADLTGDFLPVLPVSRVLQRRHNMFLAVCLGGENQRFISAPEIG